MGIAHSYYLASVMLRWRVYVALHRSPGLWTCSSSAYFSPGRSFTLTVPSALPSSGPSKWVLDIVNSTFSWRTLLTQSGGQR